MRIQTLRPGEVFVFGANSAGAHAGGAARFAHDRFGAVWGQSEGLQGRSYAIDTMSGLAVFEQQAGRFLAFAAEHPELRFLVTEVGCGIAGYSPDEVAGFFRGAPENVVLPESFLAVLRSAGAV
ncbi:A1S_2505 family phage non-structural protein [Microbacterium sp. F51-2R]|uniref:A1S_2505 family phage non-structural protein n=1 Tax=Microbacterium sp. F51-2R TaxID=3445777 RepID=UPI003FA00E02